jgi:type VI secretion system protein ImpC
MTRPTISTGGGIVFGEKARSSTVTGSRRPDGKADALHIVVLADFSGHCSTDNSDRVSIARRRLVEVDRDNIEEVFTQLDVRLQLPVSDQALEFGELDDLEPDFIYERISLFAELRQLKRQLLNPDLFEAAAREISQWPGIENKLDADKPVSNTPAEETGVEASLEDILDFTSEVQARGNTGDSKVNALIKSLVGPYIEDRADRRQAPMLAAVEEAANALMRKIMHQSAFQQLEASWRSLYELVRNIETGTDLKIFLLDIGVTEIATDFSIAETLEASELYKLLVESRQVPGATPIGLMVADYRLLDNEDDAMAALALGTIALASNAGCLAGAHERLANCPSLAATPDPDDWPREASQPQYWQDIRHTEAASHLGLVAPRLMLRLPYGKNGLTADAFTFEELPNGGEHRYYLWGNGAFAAAALLVQSYSTYGWQFTPGIEQELEDLPMHVYSMDGESEVKPCGEVYLSDSASIRLAAAGLMPLRSVKNKDSVQLPHFLSFSANGGLLQGPWKGGSIAEKT